MRIGKTATTLALLLLGTAPLLAQDNVPPPNQTAAAPPVNPPSLTNPPQTSAPEIAFDSEEFGKLPTDLYMGEASSVAVNSKGHVFVFSRGNSTGPAYGATASQLLEFDASGKFVREIGHNLYAWGYAHAVRVDSKDNIWVADKGSDMVVRFNPEGRVTLVLGRTRPRFGSQARSRRWSAGSAAPERASRSRPRSAAPCRPWPAPRRWRG